MPGFITIARNSISPRTNVFPTETVGSVRIVPLFSRRAGSRRVTLSVCIGAPAMVLDFRKRWVARVASLPSNWAWTLPSPMRAIPFFARAGRLAAMSQLEQALKFELPVPVRSEEESTACMSFSFNYHLDHFTGAWQLSSENGTTVHTGCVAFGLDRLGLARFAKHGIDPTKWPAEVRHNFPFDESKSNGRPAAQAESTRLGPQ